MTLSDTIIDFLQNKVVLNTINVVGWPVYTSRNLCFRAGDTVFKVLGVSTEDTPLKSLCGEESVYDLAKPNLDYSALIYYYTELRGEVRRKIVELAVEKKLMPKLANGYQYSEKLTALHNAIMSTFDWEEKIESGGVPETTEQIELLKQYQSSVKKLDELRKTYGLDEGDIEIFKTYFSIVRESKPLDEVKSDLVRYDDFISVLFRAEFGGTEFNRNIVEELIQGGKDIKIHYIDDVFASCSFLDIKNAFGLRGSKGARAEMTWAIVVNKTDKKIIVVFRGTSDLKEIIVDLSWNMTDCEFPGFTSIDNTDDKKTFGRVNSGFYEYLFGETDPQSNGSTKSKAEEIIGRLRADFFEKDEFDGYDLVITGHSLGGALSTLFTLRCAALDEPLPNVTNVSVASPFVGNQEFRENFRDLEMQGKIRHLRLSNYEDVVPWGWPFTIDLLDRECYKHVGMNIRLYDGNQISTPNYLRFYPKLNAPINSLRNTIQNSVLSWNLSGFPRFHQANEYYQRLHHERTKEQLSKITLGHLYGDKNITGWP